MRSFTENPSIYPGLEPGLKAKLEAIEAAKAAKKAGYLAARNLYNDHLSSKQLSETISLLDKDSAAQKSTPYGVDYLNNRRQNKSLSIEEHKLIMKALNDSIAQHNS